MAEEKKEITVVDTLSVAPAIYNMIMGEKPLDLAVVGSDEFAIFFKALESYKDNIEQFFDAFHNKLKEELRKQYLDTGDPAISSSEFKYIYIPGSTRTTFDSKALKADNPDVYNKYVKVSATPESIRTIAVKKADEKVED